MLNIVIAIALITGSMALVAQTKSDSNADNKAVYIGDPAKPKAKLKRIRPSATPPALTAPVIIAKPTAKPAAKKAKPSPSSDATSETSEDPGE